MTREKEVLLLVEDDAADARMLVSFIAQQTPGRFKVVHAERLDRSIELLAGDAPSLILLDLSLPDSKGLATFQRLQRHAAATPIVVLTGLDDENLAIQTVQQGAQDYLVKGQFNEVILARAIRYAIERKRIEEELRKARDMALETSRLKSEFLANVNHEIRTPMNAILGMTGLLVETDLRPEQREMARIVMTNAQILLSLVEKMLDFTDGNESRRSNASVEFDPARLVHEVAGALGVQAVERGIGINVHVGTGISSRVRGDPPQLRQILLNLGDNALKFTDTGHVDLGVRLEKQTVAFATLRFEVRDTGMGISESDIPRLFQPFGQVDGSATRRHGGAGMGLAISKRLVERMGGQIGCESTPGKGSSFWFTVRFQRVEEDGPPPSEKGCLPLGPKGDLPRILLVEDNPVNQAVTRRQLEKMGCAVQLATDGKQAVALFSASTFDAVLMDCQLPVMDGYQATAEIRRSEGSLRHTPVIALTAHAMLGDREKCLDAGMDDYLSKPIIQEDLRRTIARWLAANPRFSVDGPTGSPAAQPTSSRPSDPVDMEHLREMMDGDEAALREIVEMFLGQTSELIFQLTAAVRDGDADTVRRLAHKGAGSSATCGAMSMVPPLRKLESFDGRGDLAVAHALVEELTLRFAEARGFLVARVGLAEGKPFSEK